MQKIVLIISTLDTKEKETLYLKERIQSLDIKPVLMDISMRKGEESSQADITSDRVASAAGASIDEIYGSADRAQNTNIIISGASDIAKELFAQEKLDGVIAIGGSTGSLMGTEIMRSLPFGVPKLMISSTAALPGLSTRYIGTGDIALFHSVIEISGVTDILRNVVDRASCAIAGMVQGTVTSPGTGKGKAIALTMLGPCEKCASSVRETLEKKGYQVIGFSAAGVGDRAMEDMIAGGFFQGVIDLAPGGVGEHVFGFMRDAGPSRLESAGKAGIPQIISTCSVNHMTPAKSKYKPDYHERRKYNLDKFRTWLRLSPDELKTVAGAFAEKLNQARGTVKFMIPLRGWSGADCPGNPTYDPEEDRIFTQELRKRLKPEIQITETDANMEDPEFAKAVAEASLEIF